MTGQNPAKEAVRKERQERLAAELRENLKKRKAQDRARQHRYTEPKTQGS